MGVHATHASDLYILQYILASVAGEAFWVVGVAQSCDYSSLHILATCFALGAKLDMVVTTAVVVLILHEVATRGQQTPTHCIKDRRGGGVSLELDTFQGSTLGFLVSVVLIETGFTIYNRP